MTPDADSPDHPDIPGTPVSGTPDVPAWWVTLQRLGGFFELTAPSGTDAVTWPAVLSPEALSSRFATVRTALASSSGLTVEEVDPKVAVSATQISLASRLWSVALGGAVLHRVVPDLSTGNLLASPGHGGPVPLALARPVALHPGRGSDPADTADLISTSVTTGSLQALNEACARVGRTPERVLVSNAASALVGGARVLAARVPEQADATWALARALLTHPELAAGGAVEDAAGLPDGVGGAVDSPAEAFMRAGCCVFYRLPGHGLCPDCVLARRDPSGVTPGH